MNRVRQFMWLVAVSTASVSAVAAQQTSPYPMTSTPYVNPSYGQSQAADGSVYGAAPSVYSSPPTAPYGATNAAPAYNTAAAPPPGPTSASQPSTSGGAYVAAGNPFLRHGAPRATVLASRGLPVRPGTMVVPPQYAAQPNIAAAALDGAPLSPTSASSGPALGNAATQMSPPVAPSPTDASAMVAAVPQPTLPQPTAQPSSIAPPPAEPSQLHGVALLLQKQTETQASGGHPLIPVVAWADDALTQMQSLRDFTCTFKKREAVDGKLQEQQSMFVKSRTAPFSVYMYFLDQDVRGQEAIYVAGLNNGNIVAHPVGFKQTLVGTLSLAPDDPQAMEGNRYPITNFGVVNLTRRYAEANRKDLQFGESEVRIIEGARVNDRSCTCIQISHPTPRPEFKYAMTRFYIDNELNVPIRYEGYEFPKQSGQPPMLVEEYTYANLKLNPGLTDADFDPRNPQYGYK